VRRLPLCARRLSAAARDQGPGHRRRVGADRPRAAGGASRRGGVAGLFRRKPPSLGSGRAPLLITAFFLDLAAELGDRSQFFAFAVAARFDSAALAAAGATAGIMVAAVPAILLGNRLQAVVPMRAIRYSVAVLFLVAGFITAMQALQLA
jgi:putative Ca2+/H+ antiporter (TMEM165/GDT1 family)